jgi:hypothetical protein
VTGTSPSAEELAWALHLDQTEVAEQAAKEIAVVQRAIAWVKLEEMATGVKFSKEELKKAEDLLPVIQLEVSIGAVALVLRGVTYNNLDTTTLIGANHGA